MSGVVFTVRRRDVAWAKVVVQGAVDNARFIRSVMVRYRLGSSSG